MKNNILVASAVALLFTLPSVGSADPWKDESGHQHGRHEHGHEKHKHKHKHKHAEDAHVQIDVGIGRGTCNRDAVGAVVGGVIGGAIGSKVGEHNGNQDVGMAIGAIAGVLIGNEIGRDMDERDRRCTVQTLEYAKNGQTITWRNTENGLDYNLTPLDRYRKDNQQCRRYVAAVASGANREESRREACKQADGHWEVKETAGF